MTEYNSVNGSRVVVVGGGSRLGRAIALAASERGADIVVIGRSKTALDDVTKAASGRCDSIVADLSEPDSIVALGSTLGPFDHLISTVSMHATGPLVDLTDDVVLNAFDAKVFGPMRLARTTAPLVRPGGSFTFFSGQAAWKPSPGAVVTSTVNGALAFLVRALAVEYAPIRVNAVAPGIVDSGALDQLGDKKQEVLDRTAQHNPVGRVGTPEDLIDATLMLVTNGYMTGTVVHVDGGATLV
ncbi:SDR family oxidoreductase [Rhodococcus globerulus]|uniref:SDR family oxidoreductase n=1 Tax=Rhodococcus globerulus TaxID=33008 RepID=UPI00301654AD